METFYYARTWNDVWYGYAGRISYKSRKGYYSLDELWSGVPLE